MRVVAWKRLSVAVIAACAVAGCGGNGVSLPAGQTWTSPHFAYAARPEDDGVCAGVIGELEAHFTLVNTYLGLTWPGNVINYYKYVDQADLDSHAFCPQAAAGCVNDDGINSAMALDGHELVHAYTRHLGRPPTMFLEGLAEALSPRGRVFPAPRVSWHEVLNAAPTDGLPAPITYSGGGWFASYLLRAHGPAPFLTLYAALPQDADEAAVAAAFQQIYGASLDDVWEGARAAVPLAPGLAIWECAGDPVVLGAPTELRDRCDGSGSFATFRLNQTTVFTWGDVTPGSPLNVAACDPERQLFLERVPSRADDVGALTLPAGIYYLAPWAFAGTVRLAAAASAVTTTCAEAVPLELPATSHGLTLGIGDGPESWFVKLHTPAGAGVTLEREEDDFYVPDVVVADVELCPDCSGPCQPFDGVGSASIKDGQILRISGLDAPAGATVVRFSY